MIKKKDKKLPQALHMLLSNQEKNSSHQISYCEFSLRCCGEFSANRSKVDHKGKELKFSKLYLTAFII